MGYGMKAVYHKGCCKERLYDGILIMVEKYCNLVDLLLSMMGYGMKAVYHKGCCEERLSDGILIICWGVDVLRTCRPIVPPAELKTAFNCSSVILRIV